MINDLDVKAAKAAAGGDADLESAAVWALWQAAEAWDGRGAWEGYRNQRLRWAVLSEKRRRAVRLAREIPGADIEKPIGENELTEYQERIIGLITEKEKDALLGDGRTREYKAAKKAVLARISELEK